MAKQKPDDNQRDDLGELGLDNDLDLDMDIMGDEGDLTDSGGKRRPSTPTKEFFSGMMKGSASGAAGLAATEIGRKLPKSKAAAEDIAATFSEFKDMKNDLQKQLQPMMTSLEQSAQKLLPKAKKVIPNKLYEKISNKLNARATARREANSYQDNRSKDEIESAAIADELSSVFSQQMDQASAIQEENRNSKLLDNALDATRHHKTQAGLSHIYETARGSELFLKTTYTAYLKKSLELKYKHLYVARDTYELLKNQMFMIEEHLKGIGKNTALPDMVKEKPLDYVQKMKTAQYGETFANYVASMRSKIFKKVKDNASSMIKNGLGGIASGLQSAADASDMTAGLPKGEGNKLMANTGGNIFGNIAVSLLGAGPVRALADKIEPFGKDLEGTFGNLKEKTALKLEKIRGKMTASNNPFAQFFASFLPTAAPIQSGSNDMLNKGAVEVPFDRITRQSIVEVIPGFLGKILQSVESTRTGKNVEEQVFDIRSRKFTSVTEMKENTYDYMFGDEESRKNQLSKVLGGLRAGYGRGHTKEDTENTFKGLEKDINKIILNHALYVQVLDPTRMASFVLSKGTEVNDYIRKITYGVEKPVEAISAMYNSMVDKKGHPNKNVLNMIEDQISIIRNSDTYKSEMARIFEDFGQRRFFADSISNRERRVLEKAASTGNKEALAALMKNSGLIHDNDTIDAYNLSDAYANDMGYGGVEASSKIDASQASRTLKESDKLRTKVYGAAGHKFGKAAGIGAAATIGVNRLLGKVGIRSMKLDQMGSSLMGMEKDGVAAVTEFMNRHGYQNSAEQYWDAPSDEELEAEALAKQKAKEEEEAKFKKMSLTEKAMYLASKKKVEEEEDVFGNAQANKYASVVMNKLKNTTADTTVGRATGSSHSYVDLFNKLNDSVDNGFTSVIKLMKGDESVTTSTGSPLEESSNPMVDAFNSWREEYSSVSNTLFDALMLIEQNTANGVAAASGQLVDRSKKGFFGKFGSKVGGAVKKLGSGVKWAANSYVKFYSGIIQKSMSAAGYVGKGILHGLGAEPYSDIYVKGEVGPKPLVTWKQQAYDPGIVFADNGKRVGSSKEINRPCIDPRTGNIVITEEDLKKGLVTISNKPLSAALKMGVLGAGRALNTVAKGYFGIYSKAIGAIGGVLKKVAGGLFGDKDIQYFDVYLKDKVDPGKPLLTKRQQEEGVYFKGKKRVVRTKDIKEPVFGLSTGGRPKCLITQQDIEQGLVDISNKPITRGHSSGLLASMGGIGKELASILGKGALKGADLYSYIYKGLFDLGKKGILGGGKLLGKGLGRLFGNGGGSMDEDTTKMFTSRMDVMIDYLKQIATNTAKKKKNTNDVDDDGIVDGSYADQMKKKGSKEKGDKSVLDELNEQHVDVDHSRNKESEEGGGSESPSDGFMSDIKRKARGKILDKVKGSRFFRKGRIFAKRTLPKVGGKALGMLKGGAGKAVGFLGKAGGTLARGAGALAGKLPMLANVATKVPMLGSLLGLGGTAAAGTTAGAAGATAAGGLAAGGGLAGLAGAALPAAAVAAALYGGYRMASGLGTKNTQENLGIEDERDVLFEDRLASAAGFNTKFGAKVARGLQSVSPVIGLIKGIRGNDNPMTPEEVEQGRNKLQNKINKGLPGYDKILDSYDKAIEDHNWSRARSLVGKEADGIIKSMWKHSITGKVTTAIWNLVAGDKDKPMTEQEQEKARAKFESLAGKGNKKAEKMLEKFDELVSEGQWKKARELAGMEERGLFGKMFQDSKGNTKWGSVIGAAFGPVGYLVGSLFNKTDANEPMSEQEVKETQDYLQKQIDGGNKAAEKILDQFNEAVTEMNWKKARALTGKQVKSNLAKLGSGIKTTAKWAARIATFGLSMLSEQDNETPMTEQEIKKFTDKMNHFIEKGDKRAEKKLDAFQNAIAKQDWEKARKIAKMEHQSLITRAAKAWTGFWWGTEDKEMSEQEIQKFRDSMQRKIEMGSKTAEKKLEAFDDAVGAQNWKKARKIADAPDDGAFKKIGKAYANAAANEWRFLFGGDGKPMSEQEVEKARKQMEGDITDGKKGAEKKLDKFNDYVADEKWEKARKLAAMPYENIGKRITGAVGNFLFGNNENPMSPGEIEQFQGECEQRIADGDTKAEQVLEKFNGYVESERWEKARELSGFKDWGVVGSVADAAKSVWNFLTGNKDKADCDELKEKLEEKSLEDETGIVSQGLEQFETLVRRRKYNEAMDLGKDLLDMSPVELNKKHGFSTDDFEELSKNAEELVGKIQKAEDDNNGWLHPITEMQLAMLRRKVKNNPDEWNSEFLEDARSKLAEITGTDEFSDEVEDDRDQETIDKGNKLVDAIGRAYDNRSWAGSPIIKTRLSLLRNEVKSDPLAWTDEQISAWYKKMKDIDPEAEDEPTGEEPAAEETSDTSSEGTTDQELTSQEDMQSVAGQLKDAGLDWSGAGGKIDEFKDNKVMGSSGDQGTIEEINADTLAAAPAVAGGTDQLAASLSAGTQPGMSAADVAASAQAAQASAPADTSSKPQSLFDRLRSVGSKGILGAISGGPVGIMSSLFGGSSKPEDVGNKKSMLGGISDWFKKDDKEGTPKPTSIWDRVFGSNKETSEAIKSATATTATSSGDMTSAVNQLVKQNQQLINMLTSVLTTNGVKIDGMRAIADLASQPAAPQIINNNTTTTVAANPVGLDLRKV